MGKFLKTFFTLFVAMNVIGILPIFFLQKIYILKKKNKNCEFIPCRYKSNDC
ncbi:MAG: hypothetical protein NC816_06790 [Candidatus Omnitrophica bacterium]|nr:hypothetical protein [Candidatus Omnitrophota bacterium]